MLLRTTASLETAMHEPGSLRIEDCWQPGGRLRVDVLENDRIRVAGTSDGLIGLARMLLYMANSGLEDGQVVSLGQFEAMEPGSLVLELSEM